MESTIDIINIMKIFIPATIAFALGILITPSWVDFLYRNELWKKTSVTYATDGAAASITASLHNDEERKTPRMGGVIIWGSTLITTLIFFFLGQWAPGSFFEKLSFLSREQTWLPLFILVAGGLCGLVDDYLVCRDRGSYKGGGLSLSARLFFVLALGVLGAWWFYSKLDISAIHIPFGGELELGLLFVPVFILFIVGMYSGGIIDGIDGLSGGIFAAIYSAYAFIAFAGGQYDIAAFAAAVVGGILAFLWFNIPPARFFNSETGTMALTTAIVIIAFLTGAVMPLLIIAFLPIATSASSLIQIFSRKFRGGKKVFIVAPLHNHFQAIGWPAHKVVMRYWVLSAVFAIVGVTIALAG